MRISDWSSDVCSSDLLAQPFLHQFRILADRFADRQEDDTRFGEFLAEGRRNRHAVEHCVHGHLARALDACKNLLFLQRNAELLIGSRSEEHTSELQSLMRISYAVFCLKKKKTNTHDGDASLS